MRFISSAENGSVGVDLCFGALRVSLQHDFRVLAGLRKLPRREEDAGEVELRLQILGLDVGQGDDIGDLRNFVADRRLSYPVGVADEDVVYDNYGIRMIPTVFVINKKGMLVEEFKGFNSDNLSALEGIIKKLLTE